MTLAIPSSPLPIGFLRVCLGVSCLLIPLLMIVSRFHNRGTIAVSPLWSDRTCHFQFSLNPSRPSVGLWVQTLSESSSPVCFRLPSGVWLLCPITPFRRFVRELRDMGQFCPLRAHRTYTRIVYGVLLMMPGVSGGI